MAPGPLLSGSGRVTQGLCLCCSLSLEIFPESDVHIKRWEVKEERGERAREKERERERGGGWRLLYYLWEHQLLVILIKCLSDLG